MSLHDHSDHRDRPQKSFLTSRVGLAMIGFLVIGGALLLTEHRAHVLGALIWLPLILCIFLHMFMHGGHGGHGGHGRHNGPDQTGRNRSTS